MRYILVSVLSLITAVSAFASMSDSFTQNEIKYRSYFGECPSKSSGDFAMIIMKEFEKKHSLKDVKERILNEKLDERRRRVEEN